jgi:peptidoglycan/LPS O-acetylase OafA/YrhL
MIRGRIPFAGFLRAGATFTIVAYHVWLTDIILKPREAGGLISLAMFGSFAVACFFVLSGFLLGRPFLAALRDGTSLPSFAAFARDRVLRIYPLYAFAVGLATLLAPWIPQADTPPQAFDVVTHLLLIHSFFASTALTIDPPLWTMPTDAQFYIALPFIALVILALGGKTPAARVHRAVAFLALGVLASVAWRVGHIGEAEHAFADFAYRITLFNQLPGMFIAFGGGMLAALLWIVSGNRFLRRHGILAALVAVPVLLVALNQLPPGAIATVIVNDILDAVAATLVLIAGCAAPASWFASPAIVWAERLSYGVYVFHFGVLKVMVPFTSSLSAWPFIILTSVVVYAVALLVSLATYTFVEAPFLRLKIRLQASEKSVSMLSSHSPDVTRKLS